MGGVIFIGQAVREAIKLGIRGAKTAGYSTYKAESEVFKYAYRGFPGQVRKGTLHGWRAGSAIGTAVSGLKEVALPQAGIDSPDSIRETRRHMVKPRSRRKYKSSYPTCDWQKKPFRR